MNPRQAPSLHATQVRRWIPPRPVDSHKGKNGHVLVVAGSRGLSGAAFLTSLSALRIGAGLVTVAIVESERATLTHTLPEALTLSLPESPTGHLNEKALGVLERYRKARSIQAVALGPGLSVDPSVAHVIKRILAQWDLPLVLDADGLNNIRARDIGKYPNRVITPHPMELARLLEIERAEIQRDRTRLAQSTAKRYHLVCVLKGHHTVISDGQTTYINPTGNPALATGGMGDVLTGVVGGLLAQGLQPFEAACAGVFLHGLAADLARISDRGLLAREVAHQLPHALNRIGVK